VICSPETGFWTLYDYVFLDCEVENLSDQVQLIEMMINGDRWTMGGVYFEQGERKIVRSIIMRQYPTEQEMLQFPNMNAYPGGSIRLWWKSTSRIPSKQFLLNCLSLNRGSDQNWKGICYR
jgi:hypothetical protein